MDAQIREGFYHRDTGPTTRDAISLRRNGSGGYEVMTTRLAREGSEWAFAAPARMVLMTRDRAEAVARVRSLMGGGDWRWSDQLR
jgi:hypothetical protein